MSTEEYNLPVENLTVAELLNCYTQILRALKERGVIRTKNLVGDIAEGLVATKLGLMLADNSNAGYDAIDADGMRYQVKSRLPTEENPSTELGAIRNLEKREFDYLIGILLNAEFRTRHAVKVPYDTVVQHAKYKPSQKGHVLHLRGSWLKDPNVQDITHMFADA